MMRKISEQEARRILPQMLVSSRRRRGRYRANMRPYDACWLWTGATDRRGVPTWNPRRGDVWRPKRIVFAAVRGSVDGLLTHSMCGRRLCIAPDHLIGVDSTTGLITSRTKLAPSDVDAIRAAWASGETQTAIAERYDVSSVHVHCIVRGKRR